LRQAQCGSEHIAFKNGEVFHQLPFVPKARHQIKTGGVYRVRSRIGLSGGLPQSGHLVAARCQPHHALAHRRIRGRVSAVVRKPPCGKHAAAHARHNPVLQQPGLGLDRQAALAGNARWQRRRVKKTQITESRDFQPGQAQARAFKQGLQPTADGHIRKSLAQEVALPATVRRKGRVRIARKMAISLEQRGIRTIKGMRIRKYQGEPVGAFTQGFRRRGFRNGNRAVKNLRTCPNNAWRRAAEQLAGQHVTPFVQTGPLLTMQHVNAAHVEPLFAGGVQNGLQRSVKNTVRRLGRQHGAAAGNAQPMRQRRFQNSAQDAAGGLRREDIGTGRAPQRARRNRGNKQHAVHTALRCRQILHGSSQRIRQPRCILEIFKVAGERHKRGPGLGQGRTQRKQGFRHRQHTAQGRNAA